jgi:nucleotide-binding universal stress UspA family protein
MYRILVPLDGSRAAEQALPAACALARCANAELKLVHVVDLVHEVPSQDTPDEQWLHATARSDAERYLEQCNVQVKKGAAAPAHTVVVEGSPFDRIQEEARSWNADLIVMATHGHGAFDRAWLGSVADALARDSKTPVMLIRVAKDRDSMVAPESFRHVLIPLDGSRLAEHAIEPAVRFTRCNNARITLLRVVRRYTFVTEPLASSLHAPPRLNWHSAHSNRRRANIWLGSHTRWKQAPIRSRAMWSWPSHPRRPRSLRTPGRITST